MSKENQETLGQEKQSDDQSRSKDVQKEVKSLLDANELKDDQQKYKCLLIVNESKDANLTLYVYSEWSPLCVFSDSSKIIQPNEKYLHRQGEEFKFELFANFKDKRKTKKLLGPLKRVDDKLIKFTESLDWTQENLANFPAKKRVCLRKIYREKELRNTCGRPNLYEVLGLDMKEERDKKNLDDQKATINKAFRDKMRIWHPDKNFGDQVIAMQIIVAKEILLDDERRARYHNEADYDAGWLSLKRYKAIFWPECFTEEQNKAYWRRVGMLALSLGITVGGIILIACTAGAAASALVVCGAVFGTGFIGGGIQSLTHTMNKKSVVDGCDVKSWLLKAGIGFVGGTVTGGAAVGITAAVVGIGGAALESGAVTAGQFAGIGAGTGAVGGVTSSLASDAGRAFVDGEEVTLKQTLLRAGFSGAIGAGAGALGGLATQGIVSRQASAATANIEGDIGEQVVILTGARRLGNTLAREVSRQLTESGTEAIMGTAAQLLEERLDETVENQPLMEHVVRGVKNVAINAAKGSAIQGAGTVASHAINEVKVRRKMGKNSVDSDKKVIRRKARYELSLENNEHRVIWKWAKGSAGYKTVEADEPSEEIYQTNDATSKEQEEKEQSKNQPSNVTWKQPEDDESQTTTLTSEEGEAGEPQDGTIKYISEGAWFSKMIITYSLNGEEIKQEASGSDSIVKIPKGATQIEVRFQVSRPLWGDIMKYDRFEKTWCKPYEPHVFRYEKPPIRTFTISGGLRWEAVMRVSDEYHEETGEMS